MSNHRSQNNNPRDERTFAVAIRDAKELFLWILIRRSPLGDIYYAWPIGRSGPEWKKWNPQGSYHKDGRSHHKSFDLKVFPQQRQKPDSEFRGTERFISRPIARNEPRAFSAICDLSKFTAVMEVPVTILSNETYKTYIAIDVSEPGGQPILQIPGASILQQQTFDDSIPWILVSLQST